MNDAPTLWSALGDVHAEVKTLPKDGWNKQQGYNFAKGDTVVRESRALLSRHGLIWMRTRAETLAPKLMEGRLGGSMDYVGDVGITGRIVHAASGEYVEITGDVPIVAMSAKPHDKGWASSITFGTGYILLGVLNQDKDTEADIAARGDAAEKTCTAAAAEANKALTDSLASKRDTTREALWEWACDKCGIKAGDNGLPGPGELYEAEATAVLDVLQGLMKDTKAADVQVCSPEQSQLIRKRRIAFATLRGASVSDVWAEVCKRIGAPSDEPERLSDLLALAAIELLGKWIDARTPGTNDPDDRPDERPDDAAEGWKP